MNCARVMKKHGSGARIVAKIEDQSAVRQIDEIIQAADVDHGGARRSRYRMPDGRIADHSAAHREEVPALGKPVIVATQLLESMIENPVPTRAEITDVANAVFEQADAIMLSGETAMGRYPAECVRVLNRVAVRIERSGGAGYGGTALLEDASAENRRVRGGRSRIPYRVPRLLFSPGMERWRNMFPIFVRIAQQFLRLPPASKFTGSWRSAGEHFPCGWNLRMIRMSRSKPQ